MRRLESVRTARGRKGWETRRNFAQSCSNCGNRGSLYLIEEIHPARDLCIECAWAIAQQYQPRSAVREEPK